MNYARLIAKSTVFALLFWGANAPAAVLFNLWADRLDTAAGTPAPASTLVLLVADTNQNGFDSVLYPGAIDLWDSIDGSGGDDLVIFRTNLATFDSGVTPGILYETISLTFANGWDQNDRLAIFWFPTLTLSDTTTSIGDSFGSFSAGSSPETPLDGSDPWITPPNGTEPYNLLFINADGTTLLGTPGQHPGNSGDATNEVQAVPEPTTCILLALSGVILVARRRR